MLKNVVRYERHEASLKMLIYNTLTYSFKCRSCRRLKAPIMSVFDKPLQSSNNIEVDQSFGQHSLHFHNIYSKSVNHVVVRVILGERGQISLRFDVRRVTFVGEWRAVVNCSLKRLCDVTHTNFEHYAQHTHHSTPFSINAHILHFDVLVTVQGEFPGEIPRIIN